MGSVSSVSRGGNHDLLGSLSPESQHALEDLSYNIVIRPAKDAADEIIKKFNEPPEPDDGEPTGGM
jgi:hypothetical protein